MPEPAGNVCIFNKQVAIGPMIAEASVAGIQMRQFLTMLGICSMDVPIPCAQKPLKPLSLKLMTANPIICAEQPAVAAPPASPPSPSMIAIAADEIGSVRIIPITTLKIIPIRNGCNVVASWMPSPSHVAATPSGGPRSTAVRQPLMTVTAGTTRMSTFVLPFTRRPNSAPTRAATNAERGSPGPANVTIPFAATSDNGFCTIAPMNFDAYAPTVPVMSEAHTASFGAPRECAVPTAIDRKSTRLNSSHQIISYAV